MPLFTNFLPMNDATKNASQGAGMAITRALEDAIHALSAYEFLKDPFPELTLQRFRTSASAFLRAAVMYEELVDLFEDRQLTTTDAALGSFDAALRFHQNLGGILLQTSLGEETRKRLLSVPISSRFLVKLAGDTSREVGLRLMEIPLVFEDGNMGHKISADLVVIQMLELAATVALREMR